MKRRKSNEEMNEKDEEIDFVRDQAKKQITFIMKQ